MVFNLSTVESAEWPVCIIYYYVWELNAYILLVIQRVIAVLIKGIN